MEPVSNAEREKKIAEIRHNLAMGEEYSLKYVIPNNEVRFLLSEIDRLQSIQQERDKLVESVRFARDRAEVAKGEEDEWGWAQALKMIIQNSNEILKQIGEFE